MKLETLRQLVEAAQTRHTQRLTQARSLSRERQQRQLAEESARLAAEERAALDALVVELEILVKVCPPDQRAELGLDRFINLWRRRDHVGGIPSRDG